MEFNNVVQIRRSVKNFTTQEVPESKLKSLFDSARVAPSWGNKQCWKFVVVKNNDTKQKIADTIGNDNSAKDGVKEAPVTVVVCADPNQSSRIDGKDYYLVDSAIAMEHLVLAAANEGLGTCWVGQFEENRIKEILHIPQELKVVALTPVGFPGSTGDAEHKRTLQDVGYAETWGNFLQ